jgi:hypothetical protein
MSTVKTKNELRYNYNVSNNKEVLQKCTEGQVTFTDAYVFWLENEWLKVNGAEKSESTCNLQIVSNSLPGGFFFDDEHGHKVTVIGYMKDWCVVEDMHHEEPYCLPFAYVQTIYEEMVAEGNDC